MKYQKQIEECRKSKALKTDRTITSTSGKKYSVYIFSVSRLTPKKEDYYTYTELLVSDLVDELNKIMFYVKFSEIGRIAVRTIREISSRYNDFLKTYNGPEKSEVDMKVRNYMTNVFMCKTYPDLVKFVKGFSNENEYSREMKI